MVVTPASGGGPESSVFVGGAPPESAPASTSVSSLTSGNQGDVVLVAVLDGSVLVESRCVSSSDVPSSLLVAEGSEVDGAALVSVAGEASSEDVSVTPEEVGEGNPASEVSSVVGARSVVSVSSSVEPTDADDSPIVASGGVTESASPRAPDEPASLAGALAS
jgi:hypothetical protein